MAKQTSTADLFAKWREIKSDNFNKSEEEHIKGLAAWIEERAGKYAELGRYVLGLPEGFELEHTDNDMWQVINVESGEMYEECDTPLDAIIAAGIGPG